MLYIFNILFFTSFKSNFSSANSLAFLPNLARRFLFFINISIELVNFVTFLTGTINHVTLLITDSLQPIALLVTTGLPAAAASRIDFGIPSL